MTNIESKPYLDKSVTKARKLYHGKRKNYKLDKNETNKLALNRSNNLLTLVNTVKMLQRFFLIVPLVSFYPNDNSYVSPTAPRHLRIL